MAWLGDSLPAAEWEVSGVAVVVVSHYAQFKTRPYSLGDDNIASVMEARLQVCEGACCVRGL